MHSAKPCSRLDTLKASHRPEPLFNAAMVLLQMVVQIAIRAMTHDFSQLRFDRPGIRALSITRDPRWNTTGDRARAAKEGSRRPLVPRLTEPYVDEFALPVNGAVEVD